MIDKCCDGNPPPLAKIWLDCFWRHGSQHAYRKTHKTAGTFCSCILIRCQRHLRNGGDAAPT